MWPFTGRAPEPPEEPGLRERVESLEKRVDAIDLEWSEWFDKYRRLYARLAKRVHDEEKKPDAPEGVDGVARTINPLAAALLRGPRPPGG